PTRDALEKRLATMEDAKYGLAFSSGLAAEAVIAMTLLKSGNHVILYDDLYGGTSRLFNKVFNANFEIEISYVDARNPENVLKAINGNTRLIWVETPSNPLLKLCDIEAISKIARDNNALLVVDNTFMSPYFQNPLKLGADIVVHSTTKYLNGHSDSVGGAVMLSDDKFYEKLKFNQNAIGAILAPFDCYLVLRGTKTLAVRMERINSNAIQIANFLASHPKVEKVMYPGLKSHPQHELAIKQATGFGGMISFTIDGGLKEAKTFLSNLKVFLLAESLGAVESLVEHPALMTHSSVPPERRMEIGISDSLVRLSVGLEHVDDLIEDLDCALGS
ncbi:MAG TPA: PLP-dependent aspartate aminotransferase family protein, partial [Acidobacteriota bacterium]|nr:PLP-dependent aspartate aminotransferase family protein [Acidobacteriota bacterium]